MNGTTILVVEDEPLVGLEIQDDLIHLGYQVPEVVTRGEEVQRAMLQHRPDLVLMDIRLQGTMDGIDAAKLLRQNSDVPVLFLTAYSDSATLGRAAQVLPDGYLLKPFGERDLAASIELALHKVKAPLRNEKTLASMTSLIDVLGTPMVVFDDRGRWFHGNEAARATLGIPSEATGPHLSTFLNLGVREFEDDPQLWVGQGVPSAPGLDGDTGSTLSVECLPDFGGRPGGFVLTLQTKEVPRGSPVLDAPAQAINHTILGLLPRDGQFAPRMETAGFLLPSDEGSGDFYDVFPLGPHHFVFYNLDVEGRGPVPAMVVYSLRSAIRDLAGTYVTWNDEIPSPAVLLEALNEKFERRGQDSLFFTITLGIVSPVTGEFQLVRAGHTQTLWVGANGSLEWLHGEGGALGAFSEVSLEVQSGRLLRGDRLLLCSDGLLEALGDRDLDQGYSALALLVRSAGAPSVATLAQTICQAAMAVRGPRTDDMSLLVIGPRLW